MELSERHQNFLVLFIIQSADFLRDVKRSARRRATSGCKGVSGTPVIDSISGITYCFAYLVLGSSPSLPVHLAPLMLPLTLYVPENTLKPALSITDFRGLQWRESSLSEGVCVCVLIYLYIPETIWRRERMSNRRKLSEDHCLNWSSTKYDQTSNICIF